MAKDPVASALDALVAHLQGAVDTAGLPPEVNGLTVRRGWPERNTDLDLSAGSVIAVTSGRPDEERINPHAVGTVDAGGGQLTTTYKVAELTIPVQVDAWSPFRAVRDQMVAAVEAALVNQVPASSGLWLDQDDYHGRPLSFEVTGGPRYEDDAEGVTRGEWRAIWTLQCATDKVVQTDHPELVDVDADITTTIGDDGTTVTETVDLANT